MAGILKKVFRVFNGTDWDKYHFETDSEQVIHGDTTVKASIDELNSNLITGFTPLTSANKGQLKLQNGFLAVWGVVPLTSLSANATFGGLMTATVDLTSFGLKGSSFSMASPRYPGHPKISHVWDDTTKILTLVSDVNPSGGFVQWLVIGTWK